jgi:hypothetical protein
MARGVDGGGGELVWQSIRLWLWYLGWSFSDLYLCRGGVCRQDCRDNRHMQSPGM